MMRAVVITKPGGPEVLRVDSVPVPQPTAEQVRVAVRATAVNRLDILQRMGVYPPPPGVPENIPGVEFAGVVDAVGSSVREFVPGDRAFGLAGGGTYAEYLVVHEGTLVRMPDRLSFVEAAAIPEAFITAYDAMVVQGRLGAGETVLINAVGSGVGTAAVQIARAISARTIGTARTASKLEAVLKLGLDEGIAVSGPTFAEEVQRMTAGRGVDVVLELVGGEYLAEDLSCTAAQGRVVVVGLVAGTRAELDLGVLLRKRLEIRGTVLRSRSLEEKIAVTRAFADHLLPLIERRVLKAVVDRVLPLEQAGEAHAYVASNESFGKVVLQVSESS